MVVREVVALGALEVHLLDLEIHAVLRALLLQEALHVGVALAAREEVEDAKTLRLDAGLEMVL